MGSTLTNQAASCWKQSGTWWPVGVGGEGVADHLLRECPPLDVGRVEVPSKAFLVRPQVPIPVRVALF